MGRGVVSWFGVLAAALAVALQGCVGGEGSSPADGWTGTVDTLPDGAVHVRSPARGMLEAGRPWRLEEELRIGALDGDAALLFGNVQDVEEGPDGRIHVADATAGQIRIFDATGSHVRTIGREGSGPGELRYPAAVLWSPAGDLWVYDIQNGRFTVFGPDGEVPATHPLNSMSFSPQHAFDASGRLLQVVGLPDDESAELRSSIVPTEVEGGTLTPLDTIPAPRFDNARMRASIVQGGRPTTVCDVPRVGRRHAVGRPGVGGTPR